MRLPSPRSCCRSVIMTEIPNVSRLTLGEASETVLRRPPRHASGHADNLFVTCSTNVWPAVLVTAITWKMCTHCTLQWPVGRPSRGQALFVT